MSEEIKVGSRVIVSSRFHRDEVREVTRETKLYWFVGSYKYRKSDLSSVGGDIWSCNRIQLSSKEKEDEISRVNFAIDLQERLRKFDLTRLPYSSLNLIDSELRKVTNG